MGQAGNAKLLFREAGEGFPFGEESAVLFLPFCTLISVGISGRKAQSHPGNLRTESRDDWVQFRLFLRNVLVIPGGLFLPTVPLA